MKRIAAWIGGAAGAAFGYRFLRRRGEVSEVVPEADERADELRAKLAETRADEPDEPPAAEPERPETLDERRHRVHEEGRAAIDEMKGDNA